MLKFKIDRSILVEEESAARHLLADEEGRLRSRLLRQKHEDRHAFMGSPFSSHDHASANSLVSSSSVSTRQYPGYTPTALRAESEIIPTERSDKALAVQKAATPAASPSPTTVGVEPGIAPKGREGLSSLEEVQEPSTIATTTSSSGLSTSLSSTRSRRFQTMRGSDRVLGKGAFGIVFKGFDNDTGNIVAIKETHIDPTNQRAIRRALEDEFRFLTTLEHDNIVRVLGFLSTERVAQIVMEWMPGGSVLDTLRRTGFRLHERVVRRYAKEALRGLHFLHGKGMVHRDVKPANMLVSGDGRVKLSDFGTCRSTLAKGQASTTNSLVGTPFYLSPEAISEGRYSFASDVWAFACSIVHIASGMFPWSHLPQALQQPLQLVFYIGQSRSPDVTSDDPASEQCPVVPSHLSKSLRSLLLQCFRRNPSHRPGCEELLASKYFADEGLPDDAETMDAFESAMMLRRGESGELASRDPSEMLLDEQSEGGGVSSGLLGGTFDGKFSM